MIVFLLNEMEGGQILDSYGRPFDDLINQGKSLLREKTLGYFTHNWGNVNKIHQCAVCKCAEMLRRLHY